MKNRTKRMLSILLAALMVVSMLPMAALSAFALTVTDKVKEVDLTIPAPVAGSDVNLDYSSVTVKHHMTYKVVGVAWYKNHETAHLGVDVGADTYFIGGQSYTVRVDLALKAGNSGWNFDYKGQQTDYSGVKATVNGQEATVTYREVNPDSSTVSVMYTFELIPHKEIVPSVVVPAPVAGQTYPTVEKIGVGSTRAMLVAPSSYIWYTHDSAGTELGGNWRSMKVGEKFVAGEDYRVVLTVQANEGFRYTMSGAHQLDGERYIFGYINGKQTSMKLTRIGVGEDNEVAYSDAMATVTYDFVSCEAQLLESVSFSGLVSPSEGQKPVYTAPTMGDTTYTLVTDDAVTGGAEYGFVNGVAWSDASSALKTDATFQKGASYTLSFFIKAADIYRFADVVEASANIGYVEVVPMLDDPTLALVTVRFAPCDGGVLNEIHIGEVEAPMTGKTPDYSFTYSQGFGCGNVAKNIVWYDLTAEKELLGTDVFEYGHKYELRLILASDKQTLAPNGKFKFADHDVLKVKINGRDADSISRYDNNPMENWARVAIGFDCAEAPIGNVSVTVENPKEGNSPAKQIALGGDTYAIEGFYFTDGDTSVALKADDVFEGGKNYYFVVMLSPKEGYRFDASLTSATINGNAAGVVACTEDAIIIGVYLLPDVLPLYAIDFDAGEGMGSMEDILVKGGVITLPDCEFTAPDGKTFAGWTTDGGMTLLAGEYAVTENKTLTAWYVDIGTHRHVYSEGYTRSDETFHYQECISENCDDLGGSVISNMHDWGNNSQCDTYCTVCGYERTTFLGNEPLHFYEHVCSEVCPNCGLWRETVHTPGAAATCTESQTCTVCAKLLAEAFGHTPGEEATCGAAQICTTCGEVLAEATGAHTPGDEATCTEAQTCTVCGAELKAANGHSAGVEWITDEEGHHKLCGCGEKVEVGEHVDEDGDNLCDVCGYEMGSSAWVIILIVVGIVAVLGGGGACVYVFVIRKKDAPAVGEPAAEAEEATEEATEESEAEAEAEEEKTEETEETEE